MIYETLFLKLSGTCPGILNCLRKLDHPRYLELIRENQTRLMGTKHIFRPICFDIWKMSVFMDSFGVGFEHGEIPGSGDCRSGCMKACHVKRDILKNWAAASGVSKFLELGKNRKWRCSWTWRGVLAGNSKLK